MDDFFIPLPLRVLTVVVLSGAMWGVWRARGRSANTKWVAAMLVLFAVASVGLMLFVVAG